MPNYAAEAADHLLRASSTFRAGHPVRSRICEWASGALKRARLFALPPNGLTDQEVPPSASMQPAVQLPSPVVALEFTIDSHLIPLDAKPGPGDNRRLVLAVDMTDPGERQAAVTAFGLPLKRKHTDLNQPCCLLVPVTATPGPASDGPGHLRWTIGWGALLMPYARPFHPQPPAVGLGQWIVPAGEPGLARVRACKSSQELGAAAAEYTVKARTLLQFIATIQRGDLQTRVERATARGRVVGEPYYVLEPRRP